MPGFVFDTSAYLNGAHHHYFMDTMSAVWDLIGAGLSDGRIVLPREVYRELLRQEDGVTTFIKRYSEVVSSPTEAVQRRAGDLAQLFPKPGLRDQADPWVMAEAEARTATVVTYEGITFSGQPARKAETKLPALCRSVGVNCCTLPHALRDLGLRA